MVGQTRPRRRRPPARHRRDTGSHSTCHGTRNTYGTTLFGDGVRFEAFRAFGGGRKLMETLKSGEAFLSLQALSSSPFGHTNGNCFASFALHASAVVTLLLEIFVISPKALLLALQVISVVRIAELGRPSPSLPGAKLGTSAKYASPVWALP